MRLIIAYDFEFDGKKLSDFDCMICRFDSVGLETISNGSQISFNTIPTMGGSKHNLMGTTYEECLEATIQICKCRCPGDVEEISSTEFRELTKWLSRKKFLKFKIVSKEYIDLYYEAKFDISRVEINGKLYGLELQVTTNRPFALKEPKTIKVKTQKTYCWEKFEGEGDEVIKLGYVTSDKVDAYPTNSGLHTDGYRYTRIDNDSKYPYGIHRGSINDTSHEEGYIYPYAEIIMLEDGDLKIYNAIEGRETCINNCIEGEVITMEYPIIKSSDPEHNKKIQNDFNWNFFRIANTYENSRNDLVIFTPCEIKIKYSPIVKVGL